MGKGGGTDRHEEQDCTCCKGVCRVRGCAIGRLVLHQHAPQEMAPPVLLGRGAFTSRLAREQGPCGSQVGRQVRQMVNEDMMRGIKRGLIIGMVC